MPIFASSSGTMATHGSTSASKTRYHGSVTREMSAWPATSTMMTAPRLPPTDLPKYAASGLISSRICCAGGDAGEVPGTCRPRDAGGTVARPRRRCEAEAALGLALRVIRRFVLFVMLLSPSCDSPRREPGAGQFQSSLTGWRGDCRIAGVTGRNGASARQPCSSDSSNVTSMP